MKKWRLGLDIGTNSIGWSVLALEDDGKTVKDHGIVNAGSRIFSDGRTDDTSRTTLAAERRKARGARRRRDRFLQRRDNLLNTLTQAGLFSENKGERQELQKKNPLELRALALTEKLHPHEVGRALFHINQRRGFKSNRKDQSDEVKSGAVNKSVLALLQKMDVAGPHQTVEDIESAIKSFSEDPKYSEYSLGRFLWEQSREGEPTRARPRTGAGGRVEEYDVYPVRQLYNDEFQKIWRKQSAHHPDVMTDALKKEVEHHIFFQRPLRPQDRGPCQYMPKEVRTFRAMPSFQRYRIYQEVNNLAWNGGETRVRDHRDVRDTIVELLEKPSEKGGKVAKVVKLTAIKKQLEKRCKITDSINFNAEYEASRGDMDVNLTSRIMQQPEYVGMDWHDPELWPLERQDDFITIILDDSLDDEAVQDRLQKEFHLSEDAAKNCVKAHSRLVDGTASISQKAARVLLERMEDGAADSTGEMHILIQPEAVAHAAETVAGFNPPRDSERMERLPYYGEAFKDSSHIIPGTKKVGDKGDDHKFYGHVTNPTVHIALNQIRAVVNELIARYGHPHSIAIELGRELSKGGEERGRIMRAQAAGRRTNRELNQELEGFFGNESGNTHANRLRLRLWKAQGNVCFYSGRNIGLSELFGNEAKAEVDHIIPFSKSLDDTTANKVVCLREDNRYKGDMMPWQAFHDNPDYKWDEIMKRARAKAMASLPRNRQRGMDLQAKLWRFQQDPLGEHEVGEFLERHLNDTRYIGRLAREYLECICDKGKINVLTGKVTAILRWEWQVENILPDALEPERKGKNRNDHRHHAIDAIVIGMTTKSLLDDISRKAKENEERRAEHFFTRKKNGASPIEPWPGFSEEVKDAIGRIAVSHRVNHKKKGQLHEATAYGIVGRQAKENLIQGTQSGAVESNPASRKRINAFTTREHVEEIGNAKRRDAFLRAFDASGKEGVQNLAQKMGIKSLSISAPPNVVTRKPVSDFTKPRDAVSVERIRDPILRQKFRDALRADGKKGIQDLAQEGISRRIPVERPVNSFATRKDVEAIRNKGLREAFLQVFDASGVDGIQSLAQQKMIRHLPVKEDVLKRQEIRHLRVNANLRVLPIRTQSKDGKVHLKAYPLGNNWATEIYEKPDGKWEGFVVSRFEACQKGFQPGVTKRPHRNAKLRMRLFIDDMVQITEKEGELPRLMRVQKMSGGSVYICQHNLANVASRLTDLVNGDFCRYCSASTLKTLDAKKAHISPSGFVHVQD